ncbi:MAG: Gar1/Naf1 family protein [Methanocellales archaeon]
MKKLGVVLHVSARGDLILKKDRSNSLPRIDSIVVDKKLSKIGMIRDIFGPVDSPYISVKPYKKAINELRALIGEKLYIKD